MANVRTRPVANNPPEFFEESGQPFRRIAVPGLVFAIALIFYFAILPYRIDQLRPLSVDTSAPTGDEPYYLEIALSLIRYRTLDLTQAHDVDSAYREFYPEELPAQPARGPREHVSKHFPGLSVLAIPAYLAGDLISGRAYGGQRFAVCVFLAILSALLLANIYLLATESGASVAWALTITALLGLTNPTISYSWLLFPELPAALLVVYAFRQTRNGGNYIQVVAASLCIVVLPWLHPRLIAISLPLATALLFSIGGRWSRWLPLIVLGGLSGLALAAFDLWAFGTLLPNTGDHAGFGDFWFGLTASFGLLLDQQWGLLIYCPALALAGLGIVRSLRSGSEGRTDLVLVLLVGLPYFVLIALYRQWWGEWGPPARYLMPLVPLLALPLARSGVRTLAGAFIAAILIAMSLAIGALFVLWPRAMYNHPTGIGELWLRIAERGWPDLTLYLPSVVAPNDRTIETTVLWSLLFLVIAWMYVVAEEVNRPAGGFQPGGRLRRRSSRR